MVVSEIVQELQKATQLILSEDTVMPDKSLEKTHSYNNKNRTGVRL